MKNTMKKWVARTGAIAIGVFLTSALTVPASAQQCPKGTRASLNLKTVGCASSLDTFSFSGGVLTASGHIRLANSGKGAATVTSAVAVLQDRDSDGFAPTGDVAVATTAACAGTAFTCFATNGTSSTAGDSLVLGSALPVSVPEFGGAACGANSADIPFTVNFTNAALESGQPVRIELQVTYNDFVNGCTFSTGCLAGVCGNRTIVVRFGFQVP